jgi:hypothetical protein
MSGFFLIPRLAQLSQTYPAPYPGSSNPSQTCPTPGPGISSLTLDMSDPSPDMSGLSALSRVKSLGPDMSSPQAGFQ